MILVQSQIDSSNLSVTMDLLLQSIATRGLQRLETSDKLSGLNILPCNIRDYSLLQHLVDTGVSINSHPFLNSLKYLLGKGKCFIL